LKTVVASDELFRAALAVPVQTVKLRVLAKAALELVVRRDDLIDEQLSGNKFYKLYLNIQQAQGQGYRQLLSFGGAYSNHLYALAAAGKRYGFATLGVVRGERPVQLSPTLVDAEAWGMRLIFVSRADYALKDQGSIPGQAFMARLKEEYGDFYSIPEGGANVLGAQGMQLLGRALDAQLNGDYSAVCLACGTGTGMAGVAAGICHKKPLIGFSVLKGVGSLGGDVQRIYKQLHPQSPNFPANWRLISGYHGGGYGRRLPPPLARFWQEFEAQTGLLLDPVYTLKLFWGVVDLAQRGYWPKGSRIVAIHTGGLQGRRGFSLPDSRIL
jgi:1-aminocyclopropane-1-carboxylate deaminase